MKESKENMKLKFKLLVTANSRPYIWSKQPEILVCRWFPLTFGGRHVNILRVSLIRQSRMWGCHHGLWSQQWNIADISSLRVQRLLRQLLIFQLTNNARRPRFAPHVWFSPRRLHKEDSTFIGSGDGKPLLFKGASRGALATTRPSPDGHLSN